MNEKTNTRLNPPKMFPKRRGISVLYTLLLVPVGFLVISLGIDLGRLEVAKTQMRTAVDAAARYGALNLHNTLGGVSAAYPQATLAAAQNNVEGTPVALLTSDIQTGVWDGNTFQPNTDINSCNAVSVTGSRTQARNNPVPLMILGLFSSRNSYDLVVTSVARVTPGPTKLQTIPATSNPFLAGAAAGTEVSNPNPHNNPDFARPGQPHDSSPVQGQIPVVPGTEMTFDGVTGGANNFSSPTNYSADGNLDWICNNGDGDFPPPRDEQGIATMYGPINSLVGVFLDDTPPGSRPTPPPDRQYGNFADRDKPAYTDIQLDQVFFIGDGRTADGVAQQFTVPKGATRLFIGTWDCYEWNNNQGQFTITIHGPSTVEIVQ